ncbi:hypothetical protein KIN20_024015 [Parelaphostrongylus tenuis]|uniref:Uncharacterized protein n=1 Tax=Parelaphostrongylus tenuis TaxID=148309 RepID=A0AAD5QW39_PARTN|nr:hypothetical protein KIN20_024015 [Parelaphostrongylus tenuis]
MERATALPRLSAVNRYDRGVLLIVVKMLDRFNHALSNPLCWRRTGTCGKRAFEQTLRVYPPPKGNSSRR